MSDPAVVFARAGYRETPSGSPSRPVGLGMDDASLAAVYATPPYPDTPSPSPPVGDVAGLGSTPASVDSDDGESAADEEEDDSPAAREQIAQWRAYRAAHM